MNEESKNVKTISVSSQSDDTVDAASYVMNSLLDTDTLQVKSSIDTLTRVDIDALRKFYPYRNSTYYTQPIAANDSPDKDLVLLGKFFCDKEALTQLDRQRLKVFKERCILYYKERINN